MDDKILKVLKTLGPTRTKGSTEYYEFNYQGHHVSVLVVGDEVNYVLYSEDPL